MTDLLKGVVNGEQDQTYVLFTAVHALARLEQQTIMPMLGSLVLLRN